MASLRRPESGDGRPFAADQIPHIEQLAEYWGKLCGSRELASEWADRLIVQVGSDDGNAANVPALAKAHPQIRTLVIQGAQHGGEQRVLRRPEFMTTLREFLAASR